MNMMVIGRSSRIAFNTAEKETTILVKGIDLRFFLALPDPSHLSSQSNTINMIGKVSEIQVQHRKVAHLDKESWDAWLSLS